MMIHCPVNIADNVNAITIPATQRAAHSLTGFGKLNTLVKLDNFQPYSNEFV